MFSADCLERPLRSARNGCVNVVNVTVKYVQRLLCEGYELLVKSMAKGFDLYPLRLLFLVVCWFLNLVSFVHLSFKWHVRSIVSNVRRRFERMFSLFFRSGRQVALRIRRDEVSVLDVVFFPLTFCVNSFMFIKAHIVEAFFHFLEVHRPGQLLGFNRLWDSMWDYQRFTVLLEDNQDADALFTIVRYVLFLVLAHIMAKSLGFGPFIPFAYLFLTVLWVLNFILNVADVIASWIARRIRNFFFPPVDRAPVHPRMMFDLKPGPMVWALLFLNLARSSGDIELFIPSFWDLEVVIILFVVQFVMWKVFYTNYQDFSFKVGLTLYGYLLGVVSLFSKKDELPILSHTVRHKPPSGHFFTRDYALEHNLAMLRRVHGRVVNGDVKVKFFGRTMYGPEIFYFPVYCDKRTFERFLVKMRKWTSPEIRMFRKLEPTFNQRMWEDFLPCVNSQGPFMSYSNDTAMKIAFVAVLHEVFGVHPLTQVVFALLFGILCPEMDLYDDDYVYAFVEEGFNLIFGVSPVIIAEFGTRWHQGPHHFTTVIAHLLIHMLPTCLFPLKVFLHAAFNRSIKTIDLDLCGTVDFDKIQSLTTSVCAITDVVRKLSQRDYIGVLLSFGMHFPSLSKHSQLFGTSLDDWMIACFDELRSDVAAYFPHKAASGVVLLAFDDEKKSPLEYFKWWLPDRIRFSPLLKKLAAFVFMLASSQMVGEWLPLRALGEYFDNGMFAEKMDIAQLVVAAVKGVYDAVSRVIRTGSLNAFWDMPHDVYFRAKSAQFIYALPRASTREAIVQEVADARGLIDSRKYLKNDVAISRTINELEKLVKDKLMFLEGLRVRDQPFPIWLNGPPGTGKTTLIESLMNLLAADDGVDRFVGDVIKVNILDKYPIGPATNSKARYLVMNDIPCDYQEFFKQGLIPLDVLAQQLFDTHPFSLPGAAVDDKGKLLNDIKYVIITSNYKSYVFPGESEKLIRRLDYGVLVDLGLKDEKQTVTYADVVSASQAERNELMYFIVNSVRNDNKRLIFNDTQQNFRLKGFFGYVRRRVAAWKEVVRKTSENFGAAASHCDCGIPVSLHVVKYHESALIMNEECNRTVQCLTEKCMGYFHNHHMELNVKGVVPLVTAQVDLTYFYVGSPAFLLIYLALIVAKPDSSSISLIFSAALACLVITVYSWLAWFVRWYLALGMSYKFANYATSRVLSSDAVQKFVSYKDPIAGYLLKAEASRLKAFEWLKENKMMIGAGVSIASVCAVLYSVSKDKLEPLAAPIYEQDVDPKSLAVFEYRKEMNYPVDKLRDWGKESQEMTVVDFVTKGTSGVDLSRLCMAQTISVKFRSNGKVMDVFVFILNPQYMLINKHYYTKAGCPTDFVLSREGVDVRVDKRELRGNDDNEFFLVPHHFPGVWRGMHNHLPYEQLKVRCEVKLPQDDKFAVCSPMPPQDAFPYHSMVFKHPWSQGMCATPVIGKVGGGSFIAGFVCYGTSDRLGFSSVSKRWVDAMCSLDDIPFIEDSNVTLLGSVQFEDSISMNSEARNFISPYLVVIGTSTGKRDSFRSRLKKSIFHDEVAPLLSEPYGVPKTDRTVVTIGDTKEYVSAFTHSFSQVNLGCDITDTEGSYGADEFAKHIANDPALRDARVSFLTYAETIFGNPDLGIQRVNFKTSCGAALKEYGIRNKYDLFTKVDEKFALDPRIVELVQELDKKYRKGIIVAPFVDGTIKDEIRPVSKLDVAKLRIFSVLDFVVNSWGRMAMMGLLTILLNFPSLSFCCGGMNAGSVEWHERAIALLAFSKHFDIDFKTMDFCHGVPSIKIFARFMFRLAKYFHMNGQDASAMYVYIMSLSVQVFRYKGDVYLKFKGLPSGRIETLMMNSILNIILLFIVFNRVYPATPFEKFVEALVAFVVGDDNITGVDADRYPKINMKFLQPIYRGMGYVITPAAKEGVALDYVSFDNLVFVKRKFRLDDELGYVAPIATDSIYKALMFESTELGVSPEQRLYDVAMGAQREMFLHGKDEFQQFQDWLVALFESKQRHVDQLNFEVLKNEYRAKSFRTFAL